MNKQIYQTMSIFDVQNKIQVFRSNYKIKLQTRNLDNTMCINAIKDYGIDNL